MLGVLVQEQMLCVCVGPGCAMRSPIPGLAWLSEPETGLRNGSVRALPPTWRTLSGPKHSKYCTLKLLHYYCSLLQIFHESNLIVVFYIFLHYSMNFQMHQCNQLFKLVSLLWLFWEGPPLTDLSQWKITSGMIKLLFSSVLLPWHPELPLLP